MEYEEALELFIIHLKDKGYTTQTQQGYRSNLRSYFQFLENKKLTETTRLDVMKYLTYAREHGSSPRTRNRKLAAIRFFYKTLIEFNIMKEDPTKQIATAKQERNSIPTYLEEQVLGAFIRMIPKDQFQLRNQAIFMLMACCGLRVGEVHTLNISDIHHDNKGIQVKGKGNKSRYIPLPVPLYDLLLQVIEHRVPPDDQSKQALFVSRNHRRLSKIRIQKIAHDLFNKLKETPEFSYLESLPFSCHKLRHTFGTQMIKNGVDLRTLQVLMGHESVATTQIYTHISDEQKAKAMSTIKIPNFLQG